MEFRVLGPLEVHAENGPVPLGGAKQRAVLAHLLLRANKVVPSERLIDEVWEDDPPTGVRNVLQTYVSRLRKAVGDDRLERRSGGYILHAAPGEVDAERFTSLVAEARRRAAVDPGRALELYREADALWRGPALDDLANQRSLRAEIGHLEELRAAATEDRIVAELSLGRHAELVPELENLTALHPLRESLWGHLITALYRSGRQADALAAYRRARSVLVEELGIEPSAELRHLEQQVLQQDPALEVMGQPLRGFRLLEQVGEGAFGVVHRAEQPQVGREVAVKVIRPALANEPEFIRRFEAEARLVARLEHPHIVPLYDYWREPDGAYLVMRFLRGGNLREALEDGPLPLDAAVLVVEQVGAALASAHRQGVVHRDVKPGNILFDEARNAYLSDFGIALDATAARTPDRAAPTTTSADYVSPEEVRGEEPTARADVYSLGRVLEVMAGADLPEALAEITRRATAADPSARYADASAMVAALGEVTRPGARRPAIPTGPIRNPYKGLRPFNEADASDFYGRERLVEGLVARVSGDARLLALVGPSGSGKSSVVKAGLVPAVRDRLPSWFVAEMTPSAEPFAELAACLVGLATVAPRRDLVDHLSAHPETLPQLAADLLPDRSSELLLVVDQFEELFTQVGDGDRRAAFMAALQAAATAPGSRIRVVITLRADFLDRPLAQAGFAEVMRAGTELVLPMGADDLERAISGPAQQVGVTVEPGLVAELVSDAVGQPGALPLLQFTLAELFDRREEGALTLDAYRELGGVGGAVARGAEELYAALDPVAQGAARQFFLRLVQGGSTRQAELESLSEEIERVIDVFAARRLLSFDRDPATREPTVHIAHDALLEAWERLREWLAEAREDLQLQRRLAAAAREWDDARRDPSFLLRGSRLELLERPALPLTPVEQEFLDASRAAAEQAAQRDRRTNRRLRGLLAGAGVLLVAAVVAGAVALSQREDAEDAALSADAQRLGAVAVTEERLDQAVLLARAGVHLDATVATRANLLSVLMRQPAALGELRGDGWQLYSAAAAGPLLAIGDQRGGVTVYDAATRRRVSTSAGYGVTETAVQDLRFTPDAASLAAFKHGDDGITRLDLIDPRTGRRSRRVQLPSLREEAGFVLVLASFDADGSHLVVQQSDEDFANGSASVLRRVNVRTGAVERSRRIGDSGAWSLSSTADRRRLFVTVARDGRTYEVDPETLAVRRSWGDGDRAGAVAPDGRSFALADDKGRVRLLDLETGRSRRFESGHEDGGSLRMVFTPDGRTLVTSDARGEVIVWDVQEGRIRERLIGHTDMVNGLATSPDGRTLYTAGVDAKLTLWDLAGDRRLDRRFAAGPPMDFDDGSPKGLAVSPDGGSVAVTQVDGRVDLLDTPTLRVRRSARVLAGAALAVAYSADGKLLAVAGDGNEVLVRDARTLAAVRELRTLPGGFIQGLAISPDGKRIAAGAFIPDARGAPGRLQIWELQTGKPVARPIEIAAIDLAFSPDSRLLAAAAVEGESAVFAAQDGRRLATLRTGDFGRSVAFSPAGGLLALGHYGGSTHLLSTTSFTPVGRRLEGHRARITALEFSPDGRRLLTGSADGTLRLWDAASRQPIGSALAVERDAYVAAGFAGGGSHVVAVPHSGSGVRWDVRPAAWERHACLVAGRELTAREWRDALPQRAQQPVC